jgi:hypothetical protein
MLSSECVAHRQLILAFLNMDWGSNSIFRIQVQKPFYKSTVVLTGEYFDDPLSSSQSPELELVKRKFGTKIAGRGKVVDHKWIDKGIIQRWKSACDRRHGRDSRMIWAPASCLLRGGPVWLVDNWRQCLVPAQPEMSYGALSYVWGKAKFFKPKKSNLQQLQHDHAFSATNTARRIPRTIKDAMGLLDILGERYLWVDSLCIVQDDVETKNKQLNDMASIFGNACLTIVAEQGPDASFGLRGLRGVSEARNFPQDVFEFKKSIKILQPRLPESVEQSLWSQRGWTFQEHLFSPIKIFFHETLRWECDYCGVWYEDIEQSNDLIGNRSATAKHQIPFGIPFPNLDRYIELVNIYNTRQFTYSEDALPAFAGVISALSSSFSDGFLCGLPVTFFDVALLWRPDGPLQQRTPSGRSSINACLPSWSWVGWRGRIDESSWLIGGDYIRANIYGSYGYNQYRIIPIVKWYSHERKNSKKELVQSTWYDYREKFFGREAEPPARWTRYSLDRVHEMDTCTEFSLDGYPSLGKTIPPFFYGYELVPHTDFWYPIPICNEAQEPTIRPAAAFLSCETQRAKFYFSERISDSALVFSVRDEYNAWAGVIQLHNEQEDVFEGESRELVAISRGYAYNCIADLGLTEWDLEERPKSTKKYEFYNVLWIEWIDGIAYRKGIGRVMQGVWESQALESIHLTLG